MPNVLSARYASAAMNEIWSPQRKIVLDRQLSLAVLRAQAALGVEFPDGVSGAAAAGVDPRAAAPGARSEELGGGLEGRREERGQGEPAEVTAFCPERAVHGRATMPCPGCDAAVQRLRYADRECNYCARCQTGGELLADRTLSRLLKKDWPKTLDELERA